MTKKRNPRVDRAVRDAVADLVETEIADPRLRLVTFTEVQVTPDHEVATVYYSTLDPSLVSRDPRVTGGDRVADAREVAEGLESAAPRLRGLVSRRAKLRTTPELRFVPDPVVAQAARVEELLRDIEPRDVAPGTGGIEADDDGSVG